MKETARFFKVLSDEARLQMLWLLFHHRELCVCDIMQALGITQSKASRHLAALRNAGLVTDRKAAAWSYYSLHPVEDDLRRAVLHTLRKKLAPRPEAARILRGLHAWLEQKCGEAACAPGSAGGPAIRKKTAPRARAAQQGGRR